MAWYILKRLLFAVPLLIGIATVTFVFAHLAPGDPMDMYLEKQLRRWGRWGLAVARFRRSLA
ncbi:MAG: hypothetical protein ACREK5_10055 [Gemmatimonadota bacterium]